MKEGYTAILYRASTGPEQGFPCVVFPHREKPVFIAGFPVDENRYFPVGNTTQGKPCFHYRDGFAVYVLQWVQQCVLCTFALMIVCKVIHSKFYKQ